MHCSVSVSITTAQVTEVMWIPFLSAVASCADDADNSLVVGEVCNADDESIISLRPLIKGLRPYVDLPKSLEAASSQGLTRLCT